jgi:hypothetical protein
MKIENNGNQEITVNFRLIASIIESELIITNMQKTRERNNPSSLSSPVNDNPTPNRTETSQIPVKPCSRGGLNPSL